MKNLIIMGTLLLSFGCVEEVVPVDESLKAPPVVETPLPTPTPTPEIILSNIQILEIKQTSVKISWKTNIASKGHVEYGSNNSYGLISQKDINLKTSHEHTLNNLSPDTNYMFRIISSTDKQVNSNSFSFKTLQEVPPPAIVTSKPVVLKSAQHLGDDYQLIYELALGASVPAGGYDTYINSIDQNDSANFKGNSRIVKGLDPYKDQCFMIESRYTQLEVNQFLKSNEICVKALEYPASKVLSLNTTNAKENSVVINLKASLAAIFEIEYGETLNLGRSVKANTLYETDLIYELNNLKSNTRYYYQVKAVTDKNKTSLSEVKEFQTLKEKQASPSAVVIDSIKRDESNYKINFSLPQGSLLPEGGFDTIINGNDENDSSQFTGITRTITGLNQFEKQCFIIEARYTQLEPKEFLRSGEYCVKADSTTPPPVIIADGELKAFPTAQGYGKKATGGRGGKLYRVTNLNENGSGSLRYGVETIQGPRTIVFDVSGYIYLKTPLKIRAGNGNITIAGQTAPEGGITIRGASIWITEGNVIIRHLRVRPGSNAYNPSGSNTSDPNYEPDDGLKIQAWSGQLLENIILDHVSVSWGKDSLLDIGAYTPGGGIARNITIQNCLLAENIEKQYGTLINGAYNISWYRNITAYTTDRNIAISSPGNQGVEMVNSFVYGTDRSAWYREGNKVDFVSNVFVTGPRTRQYETFKMERTDRGSNASDSYVYIKDNTDDGKNADKSYNGRAAPFVKNTPWHKTGLPIIPNSQVESSLVGNVGNTVNQDAVDARIFNQIRNRTGNIISGESQVGGYPAIKSVSHSSNYDTDKDGMSDSWELQTYGSLEKDGNGDENKNGYTNLEEFLHYLTI